MRTETLVHNVCVVLVYRRRLGFIIRAAAVAFRWCRWRRQRRGTRRGRRGRVALGALGRHLPRLARRTQTRHALPPRASSSSFAPLVLFISLLTAAASLSQHGVAFTDGTYLAACVTRSLGGALRETAGWAAGNISFHNSFHSLSRTFALDSSLCTIV